MSSNSITSFGSIQQGSSYPNGFYPNQKLGGGRGMGAVADILVQNGNVVDVVLKDGGTGYAVNDVLTISPISIGNNVITGASITTAGSGYTNGTYSGIPIQAANGVGASVNLTISGGAPTAISISNGGNGYVNGNTFSIIGSPCGPGTGFSGTITGVSSATAGSGFAIQVSSIGANITTPVSYPPGYEYFFKWNLAKQILAEFGKKSRPDIEQFSTESRNQLETMNMVPYYVRGDGGMSRSGRNRYFNWITGNFWSFGNN
jgi:hypothetical protein